MFFRGQFYSNLPFCGQKMVYLLENDSSAEAQGVTTSFANRYLNHPPPEILIKIFRYSLPSSSSLDYHDGSMINVAESESICREEYHIKHTIVAVCKLWWNVGISMLYEEVIIRRIENLAAFSRTLLAIAASGSHVGGFIKKLMVSCFVSFANAGMFRNTIQRIIGSCPSLSHLFINPSFIPAEAAKIGLWPIANDVRGLCFYNQALEITHLDWGPSLALADLVGLLKHCPNLQSLRFHLLTNSNPDPVDVDSALATSVFLPNIRELHLVCSGDTDYSLYYQSRSIHWPMPNLERMTYVNTRFKHDPISVSRFHRRLVQYLHLPSPMDSRKLQCDVLDAFPALVHLVCAPDNLDVVYSLSHTKIMWIDLWVDIPNNPHNLMALVQAQPANLPSLRRIRVLDNTLWCPGITELPTLLPPETAASDNGSEYMLYGIEIQQKGRFVFRKDLAVTFAPWLLEPTDDDGSDFSPIPHSISPSSKDISSTDVDVGINGWDDLPWNTLVLDPRCYIPDQLEDYSIPTSFLW